MTPIQPKIADKNNAKVIESQESLSSSEFQSQSYYITVVGTLYHKLYNSLENINQGIFSIESFKTFFLL